MAKGGSKRDRLAAAFAKQQDDLKMNAVEETPIDELFSKENDNAENKKTEDKNGESVIDEVNEENLVDKSNDEAEEKLILVEAENEAKVKENLNNDDPNIGKKENEIQYDFQTRAIRQRKFSQTEAVKEGINLRYSEDNEDFLRIQSMKHRMSKTEFVLTLVENVMDNLSSEEISDEEFAKNARVGRRYDRTYKNHRYVFQEEITHFLQDESARRGMTVPVFFEMILGKYKESLKDKHKL